MPSSKQKTDAHYSFGFTGVGSVELRGTDTFVRKHMPAVQPVIVDLFSEYLAAQESAGRNRREVIEEFLAKFEGAFRKALATGARATVKKVGVKVPVRRK